LEKILYDGQVKLKFSPGNHCYYANGKVTQGVTSALKELYPQDDLLEWYSSMASNDIVMALAPEDSHDEIKKAFLDLYKGETPVFTHGNTESFYFGIDELAALYLVGKNAPKKRSQYGKDVGTQVHEAIDKWHDRHKLTGELIRPFNVDASGDVEQDKVAQKSFDAYMNWFEQSGLEVTESERMLYSVEQNYAGTVDRIYRRSDGGLILGDFKTSNLSKKVPTGVRESYWSQLGAYMKAYREEFGVEFVDAMIVNSPKNGSLKVVWGSDSGFNPMDLERIWLDDLKAFRNHKFMRNARLKSRV
jgi:hypothetical protein